MTDAKYNLATYYGRTFVREYLHKLQGGRCAYCESLLTLRAMTIDHVTPRDRGGSDSVENLLGCCEACNKEKGDRTLAEFCPWLADSFRENAEAEQQKPLPTLPKRPAYRGNGALNTPFNGLARALSAKAE